MPQAPMICGLMLTRSEDWVIGLSLRAALLYCDKVLVYDHLSDDATPRVVRQIANENPGRVEIILDETPWWDEMVQRQRMLDRGREMGGTHFVIVDADEVLTSNLVYKARAIVESCPVGECLALRMVSTYHSAAVRRVDWVWGLDSRLTWCFRDDPRLSWRPAADGYQHHQRVPFGAPGRPEIAAGCEAMSQGGVFHLQYITRKRLEEKAVFYKIMEVVRWPARMSAADLNQKYDWTLREGGSGDARDTDKDIHHIPDDWWGEYRAKGWLQYLRPDIESWQAREANRLYDHYAPKHPERFRGLALHGVIRRPLP